MARAYVEGWPVADPPLALLLDMLLTRYKGYTAADLLVEDYHIVEALADIARAANEREAEQRWQ